MKWIGQHIWDFISRFRSDVYLENVDSGTIASGGNLGLDSNNKIVKANTGDALSFDGSTANGVLTYKDADEISVESNLTYDASAHTLQVQSSTTQLPEFIIKNTTNDNKPSKITFLKDKGAAGGDGDYIGSIQWKSDNAAQEETSFSRIRGRVGTAADTDEAGKIEFSVGASNGSSSNLRDGIVMTGHGTLDKVDIELGYGDGDVEFKRRKLTKTSDATHFDVQGDILYLGDGSTTQGDLCYLKENGEWGQADADGEATGDDADRDAMGMLAIALGDDPDVDGMLLRGVITMDYDMGDVGNPIYVSTTAGDMTNAAPTASGDFVRVVGYCLDDTNGQIYFNPDNTWVEIA